MFVKEFVEEKELNVYVIMDLSSSNDFGFKKSKKELGFEISASLMFSALKNNDRVGMGLFTIRLEKFVPAKKGKKHMMEILKQLLDHTQKAHKQISLDHYQNYKKSKTPKCCICCFRFYVRFICKAITIS